MGALVPAVLGQTPPQMPRDIAELIAQNPNSPMALMLQNPANAAFAGRMQNRMDARQFLATQSPEDQASINASLQGGGRNQLSDWYNNAQAAGSVGNWQPYRTPVAGASPPPPPGAPPPPGPPATGVVGGASYVPPATNFAGVLNNNQPQGGWPIAGAAFSGGNLQKPPQQAQPAPAAGPAKMGYEDAKAKYGRSRAMEMQASGEVGD